MRHFFLNRLATVHHPDRRIRFNAPNVGKTVILKHLMAMYAEDAEIQRSLLPPSLPRMVAQLGMRARPSILKGQWDGTITHYDGGVKLFTT